MIKSMTAYSSFSSDSPNEKEGEKAQGENGGEKEAEGRTVYMEAKTYNGRFLDVIVRLHPRYGLFEERIKKKAAGRLSRGRVEIRLDIKEETGAADAWQVDLKAAGGYLDALLLLKKALNLSGDPSLEMVVQAPGVIKPGEDQDPESLWPDIEACLEGLLDGLDEMRTREGEYMRKDFENRLDFIRSRLASIEKGAEGLVEIYKERLLERITKLTQGEMDLDREKVVQEAAFLADKSDISEETVRAASHLEQFGKIMDSGEAAGRKLNFLLQELNREFTTMGNKIQNAEVSHIVVDVKAELEKIREQVQNVE